ncbi:Hypothetical predicted protein [Xyrichtys novacula]|uniref:Uncharacterized protein n=1 Tax=Xyrichtys novacula TaxID=13765 RepID=A0AAV1FIH4_XYRNO|nr:Hypothetical predicted protein [Xyrichtys novacula]
MPSTLQRPQLSPPPPTQQNPSFHICPPVAASEERYTGAEQPEGVQVRHASPDEEKGRLWWSYGCLFMECEVKKGTRERREERGVKDVSRGYIGGTVEGK